MPPSRTAYLIAKLNVDENQQTAPHYNITGIPAMLIFRRLVDQIVGLGPPRQAIGAKLAAAGARAAAGR